MLAAMVLLPVGDALSKLVVADHPAEQVAWVRNLTHAMVVLPFALRRGTPIPLSGMHILRGLSFVTMTVSYVAALRWLPLADAQALVFTFPMMVIVYSALILGHPIGRLGWGAGIAGCAGMLLVVQPGFRTLTVGVPLALVGAMSSAAYFILTRKLSGTTTPLMMLVVPALVSLAVLSPVMAFTWETPNLPSLAVMGLIGLLAVLSHYLLIFTYQRIEPSAVAPLVYLQIVTGVGLGWWMFSEFPDAVGLSGIVLIVVAGLAVSLRDKRHDEP